MMDRHWRRLRIHGRVQGVNFRAATVAQARALDLAGWVRNRPDGTVEALAEGASDRLDALVAWAHQGPPAAKVDSVEVEVLEVAPHDAGDKPFSQRPTG